MKTRADIVQTLGALDAQDRKWIVDRLSVAARNVLLDERAIQSERGAQVPRAPATAPAARPVLSAAESVARAGVASIAAALSGEPAWVVHALLQHQAWSWRDEFLRTLSVRMRGELAQLDASAVRHSAKTSNQLLAALAPRVQRDVVVHEPADSEQVDGCQTATTSRFEKLVSGFGAKLTRQRMRLRA